MSYRRVSSNPSLLSRTAGGGSSNSSSSSSNMAPNPLPSHTVRHPGRKSAKDFIFAKLIGEGSFSNVFLGIDVLTGREYAIKVCEKRQILREKKQQYIYQERVISQMMSNVPGFLDLGCSFHDHRYFYFVMTLAKNGNLLQLLHKEKSFQILAARHYAAEILLACEKMHRFNIIHRDLKPENILLDDNLHILIADFGSAKILRKEDLLKMEEKSITSTTISPTMEESSNDIMKPQYKASSQSLNTPKSSNSSSASSSSSSSSSSAAASPPIKPSSNPPAATMSSSSSSSSRTSLKMISSNETMTKSKSFNGSPTELVNPNEREDNTDQPPPPTTNLHSQQPHHHHHQHHQHHQHQHQHNHHHHNPNPPPDEKQNETTTNSNSNLNSSLNANPNADNHLLHVPRNRRQIHGSFVGTAQYVSPEVLESEMVTPMADLWALGCILYQMITGKTPFRSDKLNSIFKEIKACNLIFPENFDPQAEDLIRKLLKIKPKDRLGAQDEPGYYTTIRSHPFFDTIDFDLIRLQPIPTIPSTYLNETFIKVPENWKHLEPGLDNNQLNRLCGLDFLLSFNQTSSSNSLQPVPSTLNKSEIFYYFSLTPEEKCKLFEEQKLDMWHRFADNEFILKKGFINKRKGLFPRKRMFLLTTGPRLIYIDPVPMIKKGEIPWSSELKVEARTFKSFWVHTPNRIYYLEDSSGFALQWVKAIEELYDITYKEQGNKENKKANEF